MACGLMAERQLFRREIRHKYFVIFSKRLKFALLFGKYKNRSI